MARVDTIIRHAARQTILWARWKAEMREIPREERTDFQGPTGDEVIEAYTKGDGVKWARLAHKALELAAAPSFERRVRASLAGSGNPTNRTNPEQTTNRYRKDPK